MKHDRCKQGAKLVDAQDTICQCEMGDLASKMLSILPGKRLRCKVHHRSRVLELNGSGGYFASVAVKP